ncbi:thiamine-monophosphate kinase [Halioglobus japonicus]|uniref:Thiamine-monophosphate kinase n=1 Tax=Halioglobus japonicus TaxID=930805 RepID=A0AAP8MBT6_9GAMM|nr:thiamine-phosphate kinase [Halioglobus japonicus]PLW84729.1 thiamine-phosphate kinase [Halioglobus japonicus]GHD21120.1 thiamine-monophosphate kinase [Halioglobus japonicus]
MPSEFDLIYRHFAHLGAGPAVELSVGDDCAILKLEPGERLITSLDTLVEGVHFLPDTFPEIIGYRAVATAASDLAAMGARPLGMTIALTLPDAEEFWVHSFSQGLAEAVSEYSLPLVGGDTTRGPLTVSVQVMGAVPVDQALLRSGAQVGDEVYVSGTLGDAAGGLAFLQDEWRPSRDAAAYLVERHERPTARLALGQQLLAVATAAIDISDGLLADAGHIAAASGVAIELESAALPVSPALAEAGERAITWALNGGDDYELCFTLPTGVPAPEGCVRIGTVVAGEGVQIDADIDTGAGYQHF